MVYKIPQIMQIHNAGSARCKFVDKLARSAAYIFAFAYSYSEKHPFSAYGENLFQGLGTLIISSQIFYFRRRSMAYISQFIFGIGVSGAVMSKAKEFWQCSRYSNIEFIKTITIILGLTGKLPQVVENFRAQAVGELSFTTTLLNCK